MEVFPSHPSGLPTTLSASSGIGEHEGGRLKLLIHLRCFPAAFPRTVMDDGESSVLLIPLLLLLLFLSPSPQALLFMLLMLAAIWLVEALGSPGRWEQPVARRGWKIKCRHSKQSVFPNLGGLYTSFLLRYRASHSHACVQGLTNPRACCNPWLICIFFFCLAASKCKRGWGKEKFLDPSCIHDVLLKLQRVSKCIFF